MGLLGDPDPNSPDYFFSSIGLGLGASDRAKELVVKGLIFESMESSKLELAAMKTPVGRPPVIVTIDMERANRVLGTAERMGRSDLSQVELINVARQVENILIGEGIAIKTLFGPTITDASLKCLTSAPAGQI